MNNDYIITVVGAGYVGLSIGVLLAANGNNVKILDIDNSKIRKINESISPIDDKLITKYLSKSNLSITATDNQKEAFEKSDYVIIATPTNFDENLRNFDTASVDQSVSKCLDYNQEALIVIKSTLPIGHTEKLQNNHKTKNIIFSPEFLREGNALHDNLFPSRIVIGSNTKAAEKFGKILASASSKDDLEIIYMSSSEAESVKLFSNSYLAMRVAFFNELDSFAFNFALDTKKIIQGMSLDPRIGMGYNNTSFGYGGYCLPKDTKQLESHFKNIPQSIISSIVLSNEIRKDYIVEKIIEHNPKNVGIHRLQMKSNSDNYRLSSMLGIINRLKLKDLNIIIYEPLLDQDSFNEVEVISDLDKFKSIADIIVTNRNSESLKDVSQKVFTRDIFGID